jgi:hypothetical protein
MHTIYLGCDIDQELTTDKLAEWDLMVRFNRVFGEISGTSLTSKTPGASFVMKLNFHDFDKIDGINQAKLNRLLNELKRECGFLQIDVHKETSEEKELFAEYEANESTTKESKTFDEDLGSMTLLDGLSLSPTTDNETDSSFDNDEGEQSKINLG